MCRPAIGGDSRRPNQRHRVWGLVLRVEGGLGITDRRGTCDVLLLVVLMLMIGLSTVIAKRPLSSLLRGYYF